ncbi:MAG: hypothetical protein Q7K57_25000 [Burkholderiaceae bacterium]|nr:hypothetical protein [Burkholderiaceae bacterium]
MSFNILIGLLVAACVLALVWFNGADKKFKAIREGLPVVITEQAAKVKGLFGKLTSLEWWKARKQHQWYLLLSLVALALVLVWAALPAGKPADTPRAVTAAEAGLPDTPMFDVNAAKRQQAKRGGKATPPTVPPKPTDYEPWTPAPLPEPAPDLPAVAIAKAPEAPVRPVIPLTARQQAYEDRQAGRSLSFNQEK